MKFCLTSLLVSSLLVGTGWGEDKPLPWSTVTFVVPREEGESPAEVTLATEDGALTKVVVKLGEIVQEVPEGELADLTDPRLASAELLFGADWYGAYVEGEEATPHQIVTLEYGEESKFGGYATTKILFYKGKYQGRMDSVRETLSTWLEYSKAPGEKPVKIGTTTRAMAAQKGPGGPGGPGGGPAQPETPEE